MKGFNFHWLHILEPSTWYREKPQSICTYCRSNLAPSCNRIGGGIWQTCQRIMPPSLLHRSTLEIVAFTPFSPNEGAMKVEFKGYNRSFISKILNANKDNRITFIKSDDFANSFLCSHFGWLLCTFALSNLRRVGERSLINSLWRK